MSTNASLSHKLVSCLESAFLNPSLVNRKCGNLCHSRWLTTGQAILWLNISDHGLKGDILKNLKVLSQFVAQIYFHVWFRIKVKHSIVDGPHHLIKLLYLLRAQTVEVKDAVSKSIQNRAFHAHSESLLISLLATY